MARSKSLSKSSYCSGVQCPKMLWLKEHRPELFDESVGNQAVLETGSAVGDLAMGIFGSFDEVQYARLSALFVTAPKTFCTFESIDLGEQIKDE